MNPTIWILSLFAILSSSSLAHGQTACNAVFIGETSKALPPAPLFRGNESLILKLKSNFTKIEASSDNESLKNMKRVYPADLTGPDGRVTKAKAEAFGDSASNRDEATFRKLHLTLEDGMEVYIGTHVQTHPKERWTPQGRITDGTSPFREALVYDLAKVLDIPTPAHRRAIIEYTDADTGETFTKPALLIESLKDTAQRQNTRIVSEQALDEKKAANPIGNENVSVPESIRIHLFQVMVGNSDFALEIYNTRIPRSREYADIKNMALTRANKNSPLKPIAYDFDIASMVTGYEVATPSKPWGDLKEITPDTVTATMLKSLLTLRMNVKNSDLRKAAADFMTHEGPLKKTIANAVVDERGRALALDHVDHFFEALKMVWRKDIQFVKTPGQQLYPEAKEYGSSLIPEKIPPWYDRTRPRKMRQGSPFVVLGEEGDFLKVLFIDPYYELKDYGNRVGYIKKNIRYSNQLEDADVPFLGK